MSRRTDRNPSIEDLEIQDDNPMSRTSARASHRDLDRKSSSGKDVERLSSRDFHRATSTGGKKKNVSERVKSYKESKSSGSMDPASPPKVDAQRSNVALVPPEVPQAKVEDDKTRYIGNKTLQYGIWAHYMGYGCALLCIWFGITAVAWDDAHFYACRVDGEDIWDGYIMDPVTRTCAARYGSAYVCCNRDDDPKVTGNTGLGVLYILYGVIIVLIENYDWGFGMWFPNNLPTYNLRISPLGAFHIIFGIAGLAHYSTCLAGLALISNGIVYFMATWRKETGDGGRAVRKKQAEKNPKTFFQTAFSFLPDFDTMECNPIKFCKRIYNEDKLSTYFWTWVFIGLNFVIFVYTLYAWYAALDSMKDDLLKGTIDYDCGSYECRINRQIIRSGPISNYAPWAKACGGCLNLDCALLILPVIRLLLSKLNNLGTSYSRFQSGGGFFSRFCAHPITRYVPIQKNIEFHKLAAAAVFLFAAGHTVFHCLNLSRASETTLARFRVFGWDGTDFLTGAIITLAMFYIYSAAPDLVRHAKFEIFFTSHHFFIVFYLFLLMHGPSIVYWCVVPLVLYVIERYLQSKRGSHPYVVTKVEWIPPVMALQIRPVFKEHFPFKEGQYLYLNCPYISESEWHPFTISSAYDDLHNGPRIYLETGEEVIEVPRPSDWPAGAKWNKYCLVSQDYKKIPPEFLIDKSETGYHDYVSLHIKVHGLDLAKAKSWTRKLKEYFELMNPGDSADPESGALSKGKFPFYFTRRDARGDIVLGRQFGPDGKQILRVDGPHSAPAEHYTNYGTVMLIGAGIGLTPCVSILTAMTKYRWRKNFTPEILHFYWIVRQNEVDSFQWLVHSLAELQYSLLRLRASGQVEQKYYCEINIFVTGVGKERVEAKPLFRPPSFSTNTIGNVKPAFLAEDLYDGMLNPVVSSKGMVQYREQNKDSSNRFQDIWVWNGRPNWDEIFEDIRDKREHPDVGVCFCGAPVIGADLRSMCEKYSSVSDDILFSLHKENF